MSSKPGRELFHQAHYNVLAKRIRELRYQAEGTGDPTTTSIMNGVLDDLVSELEKWFKQDNERFKPELWREATSL